MGEGTGCSNTRADLWGTKGSNPLPSSSESLANSTLPDSAPSAKFADAKMRDAHLMQSLTIVRAIRAAAERMNDAREAAE
jgi:hypothetical protein